MFPNLTVRENLIATARNPAGRADPWTLDRVLERFPALAERRNGMGSELSGGEQQRVSIARAFVNRPLILLADEPTGNLDTASTRAIIELLQDLNRRDGITIVLVTQEEEVAGATKRTVRLLDGKVLSDEPIDQRVVGGLVEASS